MERDKALHVDGHRFSLASNIFAGTTIARPHTRRVCDMISGRNVTRSGFAGHKRVRIERQIASMAGSLVSSCHTGRAFPSRTGIWDIPRPPRDSCERLGDDRMFSIDCTESCTVAA